MWINSLSDLMTWTEDILRLKGTRVEKGFKGSVLPGVVCFINCTIRWSYGLLQCSVSVALSPTQMGRSFATLV